MKSIVTEIAPDVYRISTFHPEYGMQFNQFLINDDEPFIMHTRFKKMFPITLEGIASVIDPSRVRWIGFSHFESAECGALNEWLGVAPHAPAVLQFRRHGGDGKVALTKAFSKSNKKTFSSGKDCQLEVYFK